MKDKILKYSALFLIIANSGIPYFASQRTFLIASFLISLILFLYHKKKVTRDLYFILGLFIGVEILQDLIFGNLSLNMHISTFLKICSVYFIIKVLQIGVIKYFINIILFFSTISLFFFIGEIFFNFREIFIPRLTHYFIPFENISQYIYSPNVILYTFNPEAILTDFLFDYRNSGPFYEPGVFSIFIIIAFIFNFFYNGSFNNTTSFFLGFTLITTFSTAGYIAFFTIISSNILLNSHIKFKVPLLISTLLIMYYGYFSLSFMKEKIEQNIELADVTTSSRFGSAKVDFAFIVKRPFFGYGKNIVNIFGEDEYDISTMHRNNGLTKLIVNYGFLIFIIYMSKIYQTFFLLCKITQQNLLFGMFCFLAIIILGFSQSIFNYPAFYLFLFFPLILNKVVTTKFCGQASNQKFSN